MALLNSRGNVTSVVILSTPTTAYYSLVTKLLNLLHMNIRTEFSKKYIERLGRYGDRFPMEGRFSESVQTVPGAYIASYTMGTWSFLGAKRPRRGDEHPPPSKIEVKEIVALYIYSPSGPSRPVEG